MENTQKPEVRFGEWISEGWKMFTEQWQAWVINSLIVVGIIAGPMVVVMVGFYVSIFTKMMSAARTSNQPPDIGPEILGFYAVFFVVWVFTIVASCFFTGGMHMSAIKQMQGGKIEVRDIFSGARYFFPILGATLLTVLLTMIGSLLCIVPGFLVMGGLFFTLPLITHRKMGVIEAMQRSYDLTKQNIWRFTLFAFVTQLIAQAGAYAFYVGLLATFPLLFTITAVAYRDLFGVDGARYFRPNAAPPPGYGQAYPQPYSNPYPPQQPMPFQQTTSWNAPRPPVEPPSMRPPSSEPQVVEPPTAELPPSPPPVAGRPPAPTIQMSSIKFTANPDEPAPPPVPTDQVVPPKTDDITAAPTGLVCSQCQTALPPTALFCPRCGTHTGQ